MKKLLFIPLIVFSTGLFAQKFQIGIKGGVNVSNFTGSSFNNVDKKAYVGFHAGGLLSFLLGNNFAIQPEVLFSTQGAKFSSNTNAGDYKVSYLTVPVLAKYRFNGGFYIEAGPQVGFKLNESTPNNSINNFAKNLDLSADAGLGFHSNGGFGIGARYCVGLSKVGNFDASNPNGWNPNFRNGLGQIFIFYTLFNNHRDH
jgi:hypothetical protein